MEMELEMDLNVVISPKRGLIWVGVNWVGSNESYTVVVAYVCLSKVRQAAFSCSFHNFL